MLKHYIQNSFCNENKKTFDEPQGVLDLIDFQPTRKYKVTQPSKHTEKHQQVC